MKSSHSKMGFRPPFLEEFLGVKTLRCDTVIKYNINSPNVFLLVDQDTIFDNIFIVFVCLI